MSAEPDPRVLVRLLGSIERFDFDEYLEQLERLDEEQIAYSMTQAAVAVHDLAERLLGRPPEEADAEGLARVVAERHGRMLSPGMGSAAEFLARGVAAPETTPDQPISGALLLYPVLLAALGGAYDESRGDGA